MNKRTTHHPRSTFSVVERPGFLCLIDHDRGRSVTNDAEDVIASLVADGHDLSANRVIYRDTRGVWDELLVADGVFGGFKSINETDLDAAIEKAGWTP
jgi:hypothetical protein